MADEPVTPTTPGDGTPPADPKPQDDKKTHDQLGFAQRQQEKAEKARDEALSRLEEVEKKLKTYEDEKLTAEERKTKEVQDANTRADSAERKAKRLEAIFEADLPKELANLVPDTLDDPAAFIAEKLVPLKEKFIPTPTGIGNPTQPDKTPVPDEAQKILSEWNAMLARGVPEREAEAFYAKHRDVLSIELSKQGK